MRIYLRLNTPKDIMPFNYQNLLTGVIHKWIGMENEEHGKTSYYSFSWLQNTASNKSGIKILPDSYFFISAYDSELLKQILRGIMKDPEMFHGLRVLDVQIVETPLFGEEEHFILKSPILIRRKNGDKSKHVTYQDEDFESLVTANLQMKLKKAGLNAENVNVTIDRNYHSPQTKLVDYNGIKNKASVVPVVIKGQPEQIAFAWEVGLGHSTGIGFGALK